MFKLILLIAHVFSDFIFQSKSIVNDKSKLKMRGFIKHFIITLVIASISLIWIHPQYIKDALLAIVVVSIIHIILDFIKEFLKSKLKKSEITNIILFSLDQIFHLLTIIIIAEIVYVQYRFNLSGEILKILFILLYICYSGIYFVPLILNLIYRNVENYSVKINDILKEDNSKKELNEFIDLVATGRFIGFLERMLIVIFLIKNQFSAIGFLIGIKSIARFKMMESKVFSEYYLIGTLSSITYTFIIYEILHYIL